MRDPGDRECFIFVDRSGVPYDLVELDQFVYSNTAFFGHRNDLDLATDLLPKCIVVMPVALVVLLVSIFESAFTDNIRPRRYEHEVLELSSLLRFRAVLHVVS